MSSYSEGGCPSLPSKPPEYEWQGADGEPAPPSMLGLLNEAFLAYGATEYRSVTGGTYRRVRKT